MTLIERNSDSRNWPRRRNWAWNTEAPSGSLPIPIVSTWGCGSRGKARLSRPTRPARGSVGPSSRSVTFPSRCVLLLSRRLFLATDIAALVPVTRQRQRQQEPPAAAAVLRLLPHDLVGEVPRQQHHHVGLIPEQVLGGVDRDLVPRRE